MKKHMFVRFVGIIVSIHLLCNLFSACGNEPNVPNSTINASEQPIIQKVDLGFTEKIPNKKDIKESLPMAQPGQGFGIGLYNNDGTSYSQDYIYPKGETSLFISLYSYVTKDISYKLIQFVDFVESPIIVDNIEYKNGFDFDMPQNSSVDIPLSLNIKNSGLHEILFVFVIDPDNKSLDEEYRFRTNMNHLLTYRIFIKIDNGDVPQQNYLVPSVLLKNTSKGNTLLNKDKDKWTIWLTDTVNPNEIIPSYLHIGTAHNKSKERLAIIVLVNWEQVKLNDNGSALYCEIEPNLEAVIPLKLYMPSQPGVYNVTTITTESIYDVNSGFSPKVSFRIGIDVNDIK